MSALIMDKMDFYIKKAASTPFSRQSDNSSSSPFLGVPTYGQEQHSAYTRKMFEIPKRKRKRKAIATTTNLSKLDRDYKPVSQHTKPAFPKKTYDLRKERKMEYECESDCPMSPAGFMMPPQSRSTYQIISKRTTSIYDFHEEEETTQVFLHENVVSSSTYEIIKDNSQEFQSTPAQPASPPLNPFPRPIMIINSSGTTTKEEALADLTLKLNKVFKRYKTLHKQDLFHDFWILSSCLHCQRTFSCPRDASRCLRTHNLNRCWKCNQTFEITSSGHDHHHMNNIKTIHEHNKRVHHIKSTQSSTRCPYCTKLCPVGIGLRLHIEQIHFHLPKYMRSEPEDELELSHPIFQAHPGLFLRPGLTIDYKRVYRSEKGIARGVDVKFNVFSPYTRTLQNVFGIRQNYARVRPGKRRISISSADKEVINHIIHCYKKYDGSEHVDFRPNLPHDESQNNNLCIADESIKQDEQVVTSSSSSMINNPGSNVDSPPAVNKSGSDTDDNIPLSNEPSLSEEKAEEKGEPEHSPDIDIWKVVPHEEENLDNLDSCHPTPTSSLLSSSTPEESRSSSSCSSNNEDTTVVPTFKRFKAKFTIDISALSMLTLTPTTNPTTNTTTVPTKEPKEVSSGPRPYKKPRLRLYNPNPSDKSQVISDDDETDTNNAVPVEAVVSEQSLLTKKPPSEKSVDIIDDDDEDDDIQIVYESSKRVSVIRFQEKQ